MPRQNKHWFWYSDRPYLHSGEISDSHFRALGYLMTGLAGAINAGGFFAVNSFTSHITGALSHTANELYARQWFLAVLAMAGVVAFVLGSAHASWLILWAKRQKFRSSYGMSMWLEALYLLFFGLLGFGLEKGWSLVHPTVWLLSFIMGMHNTVLTVLSGSVIRSTHMTGAATDLGIELSKMLYYRRDTNPRLPSVNVNRPKMRFLLGILGSFIGGGVIGTWGYQYLGYHFTLPVSLILFMLGMNSVGYDIRIRMKWLLRQRLRRK